MSVIKTIPLFAFVLVATLGSARNAFARVASLFLA